MRVARVSRSRAAVAHRIARGGREPLATCAVGNGWRRPRCQRWRAGNVALANRQGILPVGRRTSSAGKMS